MSALRRGLLRLCRRFPAAACGGTVVSTVGSGDAVVAGFLYGPEAERRLRPSPAAGAWPRAADAPSATGCAPVRRSWPWWTAFWWRKSPCSREMGREGAAVSVPLLLCCFQQPAASPNHPPGCRAARHPQRCNVYRRFA